MARYIDGIELLKRVEDVYGRGTTYGVVKDLIKEQPTADVVEVVWCKDCRYCDLEGRCEAPENGLIREYVKLDDFCSYGERRTDNDL